MTSPADSEKRHLYRHEIGNYVNSRYKKEPDCINKWNVYLQTVLKPFPSTKTEAIPASPSILKNVSDIKNVLIDTKNDMGHKH